MADNWETWVKANGKWLAVGAAALLVLVAVSNGNDAQQAPQQGDGVPSDQGGYPDGSSPYDQGSDDPGGFDIDKWRKEQSVDDGEQRERVDRIREVEHCTDDDGKEYEVPASQGCDD